MRLLVGARLFALTACLSAPILVGAGCGGSDSSSVTAAPTSSAAAHAASDVTVGSHEDWCAEHAVPESVCTKCNPALIAAFKATGDWCAEHGLPESHCKLCNPGLVIERPPPGAAPKGK